MLWKNSLFCLQNGLNNQKTVFKISCTAGKPLSVFTEAGTQHFYLLLGSTAVPVGLIALDMLNTTCPRDHTEL